MMDRRRFAGLLLRGVAAALSMGCQGPSGPVRKRVLIVTQTAGYRHSSIPTLVETVSALGLEADHWEVTAQADSADDVASLITDEELSRLDAVCFGNTTGDLNFTTEGRQAFYDWVRSGGAFVGIHSASDTFHGDVDYQAMLGGEFLTHGPGRTTVEVFVQDPDHPACRHLPVSYEFSDEIYEFVNWERAAVHTLLSLHHHPQNGDPGDYPLSWAKRFGRGRVFYTALGHFDDVFQHELYRAHLRGGVLWALGLEDGDDEPGNPIR